MTLAPPATGTVLELDRLTVRYGAGCARCEEGGLDVARCPVCGSIWACRGVSVDVRAGEALGIVGESGSGKSTLLACANLDIVPTAGRVMVCGEDVTAAAGGRRRQLRAERLGIVYQSARQGLDMGVSAGGNVASRLLGTGVRSYERLRERAEELHVAMELPAERLDDIVTGFSGGMRQRVQLCKALATNPPVLLLDEPTSGLDVSVQARLLDLVRRVHLERNVAVVIVSHDLAVIRMLAAQVLVMRQGRIVERGVTDQVLGDPQHPYTQLLVSSQLG